MYWTVPDAKGDITGWQHLDATDLPTGVAGSSAIVSGSQAFLIGGTTSDQPAVAGSARANLAPQPPFFQLGLFGLTVPALKIGGEIGQQLGYMNAAGVATVNFIILLLIGWAFAHKERSKAIVDADPRAPKPLIDRPGRARRGQLASIDGRRATTARSLRGCPRDVALAGRELAAPDRQAGSLPGGHPAGHVQGIRDSRSPRDRRRPSRTGSRTGR